MTVAIVKVPIAALLAEAKPAAERVDEVLHGWQVEILAVHGEYFEVLTDYGYRGFVYGENLAFDAHGDYFARPSKVCPVI